MVDASRYGTFYWCVKVTRDLSKDGEIYLMADRVRVHDGTLEFVHCEPNDSENERINLMVPAAKWLAVYAASVIDGAAVAVEHWAGEVARDAEDLTGLGEADRAPPDNTRKTRGVTKTLRYRVLARDSFRCRSCGRGASDGVTLEVDHVTSEALGGETNLQNLQALCRDCNRGKGPL